MNETGRDYTSQIAYYSRRHATNPGSRVFAPLADLYRRAGRCDEALRILEEGLREHPDYVTALVVLGRCHQDSGDLDAAARSFARTLELDPDNLIALRCLAVIETQRHSEESALRLWSRVALLDTRDEEALREADRLRALRAERRGEAGRDHGPGPGAGTTTDATTGAVDGAGEEPAGKEAGEPVRAEPEDAAVATPGAAVPEGDRATAAGAERRSLATKTLAEIYLAQGHRERALAVLREILQADPSRDDVAQMIAEIESGLPDEGRRTMAENGADGSGRERDRRHFASWIQNLRSDEES